MNSIVIEKKCIYDNLYCTDNMGYTRINIGNKQERLARVIWLQSGRRIPKGKILIHKCGDPKCINIDHLAVVDKKDNIAAMKAAQPTERPDIKGEKNLQAKLTEEEAKIIKYSSESNRSLAKRYNISSTTVFNIKNGKQWSYL